MTAKQMFVRTLGILAVLCGGFLEFALGIGLLRSGFVDIWSFLDDSFILMFGCYLAWVGIRAIRFSMSLPAISGIKWGRCLAGAWLIYSSVKNHVHPAHNLLKADNETQAQGMLIAAIAIAIVGVWLFVSGIKPKSRKQANPASAPTLIA